MIITFLGTGTSQGVPVIACKCRVCKSRDPLDKRLRTSVHIATGSCSMVIDAGPDFRQQMLRENITRLDAVLITHQHRDHVAGLDDVRSYNFIQHMPMPVYGNKEAMEYLKCEFHYAFENDYPGVPQLDLREIKGDPLNISGIQVLPVEVKHHRMSVFGFRIRDFTYITDANFIPPGSLKKISGTRTLVINALRKEPHISHFNLSQALEVIEDLKPERAYLTHISHRMGLHRDVERELPAHVHLAYDGLKIEV